MRFKISLYILSLLSVLSTAAGAEEILVPESATKRVLVPSSDIGQTWRARTSYADSDWLLCSGAPGGVGYEMQSGYENRITLDVSDRMYESGSNPNSSCYIRILFSLTSTTIESISKLTLRMRYDDGFLAYLNGVLVAQANADGAVVWNAAASATHEADGQDSFTITEFKGQLKAGDNLLAIQGLNSGTNSSDFLINAELVS
ncbi:hypothetical protein JW998_10285, partial [candidate division KSB1 bacterium]|nr:hypothetical protein [candidate division KSB1 bacterium]